MNSASITDRPAPDAVSQLVQSLRDYIGRYGGENTSTLLLYEAQLLLCRIRDDVRKARLDLLESDRPVAYLDYIVNPAWVSSDAQLAAAQLAARSMSPDQLSDMRKQAEALLPPHLQIGFDLGRDTSTKVVLVSSKHVSDLRQIDLAALAEGHDGAVEVRLVQDDSENDVDAHGVPNERHHAD